MVFEKHGLSLYDFMQKNSFRPFSVTHVREIGYQLLHSISCIHMLRGEGRGERELCYYF